MPQFEHLLWIFLLLVFFISGKQLSIVSKQRKSPHWWWQSLLYGGVCVACLLWMVLGYRPPLG